LRQRKREREKEREGEFCTPTSTDSFELFVLDSRENMEKRELGNGRNYLVN
jgi:hypothetical protein